jgi:hypothetical protein
MANWTKESVRQLLAEARLTFLVCPPCTIFASRGGQSEAKDFFDLPECGGNPSS